MQSAIKRLNGFGRLGYSLNDDNEIYATVNWARVESSNTPNPGAVKNGLTLSCSNPFVPAASLPGPADVSAYVRLEQPRDGGHVGFARGRPPGDLSFLPQRVLAFFDSPG